MMLHTTLPINVPEFLRYSPDKILKVKFTMERSNQGHIMMLHPDTSNQCPYQVSTSYTLWFLRHSLETLFPTTRQTPALQSGHHG